jgi:hypothetical protein
MVNSLDVDAKEGTNQVWVILALGSTFPQRYSLILPLILLFGKKKYLGLCFAFGFKLHYKFIYIKSFIQSLKLLFLIFDSVWKNKKTKQHSG